MNLQNQSKRTSGFSLLEVLLSITILSALLGIGVPYFYDSYQRESHGLVATNLVYLLETARQRAVLNVDGCCWGVRIESKQNTMTLFKETNYILDADYNEVISYPKTTLVNSSAPFDIKFLPNTGEIFVAGTPVEYTVSSATKFEQIFISPSGVVTY